MARAEVFRSVMITPPARVETGGSGEYAPTTVRSGREKVHTSSGRAARGKHRQLVRADLRKTARGWVLSGKQTPSRNR